MAIPNSTFTQILSSSLQNRSGVVSNNIAKRNALYSYTKKKGNIKKVGGGESIVRPIEYASNATYTRYTAAGLLNTAPSDILTSCQYPWKQIAMTIQQNGLEDIQNAGKEKIVDLLSIKQRNCETTFVNTFSGDMYSDGTADSGLQIGGLQALVCDDPTAAGTPGGINQVTQTWWRNTSKTDTTSASPFGAACDATNIRGYVETMYLAGLRDGQQFDLAVSDNSMFQLYTSALRAVQRIGTDDMVEDGILKLKVFGMDWIYDGGADGQCPTGRMYFLNSDFFYLVVASGRDFKALPGDRQPINQDVSIKILTWAGNYVCTNRRAQAVLIKS